MPGSGADLEYQRLLTVARVDPANAKGYDAALLEQITDAQPYVDLGALLGNIDNTSDAQKNAAVATLTNKTISGANNTFVAVPTSALNGNIPASQITGLAAQAPLVVTTAQRDALTGVDLFNGRTIYNITFARLETYRSTGTAGWFAASDEFLPYQIMGVI